MNTNQQGGMPVGIVAQMMQGGQAFVELARETWGEYERDYGRYLAGAMVYYALVSLVPLLLLAALGLLLRFSTFAASSCPLILLTLGLFTFVVNALCLLAASWLAQNFFGAGFVVDGFFPALWGSIIVSIVSTILSLLLVDRR